MPGSDNLNAVINSVLNDPSFGAVQAQGAKDIFSSGAAFNQRQKREASLQQLLDQLTGQLGTENALAQQAQDAEIAREGFKALSSGLGTDATGIVAGDSPFVRGQLDPGTGSLDTVLNEILANNQAGRLEQTANAIKAGEASGKSLNLADIVLQNAGIQGTTDVEPTSVQSARVGANVREQLGTQGETKTTRFDTDPNTGLPVKVETKTPIPGQAAAERVVPLEDYKPVKGNPNFKSRKVKVENKELTEVIDNKGNPPRYFNEKFEEVFIEE